MSLLILNLQILIFWHSDQVIHSCGCEKVEKGIRKEDDPVPPSVGVGDTNTGKESISARDGTDLAVRGCVGIVDRDSRKCGEWTEVIDASLTAWWINKDEFSGFADDG